MHAYHERMVLALEILLVVSLVAVAASFVAVVYRRVPERWLAIAIALLIALAGFAAIVLAVGLATDRWSWQPVAVVFGGLVAAALAEVGALGLSRGMRRMRSVEDESALILDQLDDMLAANAAQRAKELEHTLARERAETIHLVTEEERRIRDERRIEVSREAELAGNELIESVTSNQQRLEHRLAAWSSDLERAQQQLKARLEELIRHQAEALKDHESRLNVQASEVSSLEEEQNVAIARVRAELDRAIVDAAETAKVEIEAHATERRKALHEVGERLRARERAMREQVDREEVEVRAQLSGEIAEVERRALEQLDRLMDRAVLRLSEDAERRFDAQLRDAREKTADRLSRELELSMETFTRSAEKEVAARISEAAQSSALKLQRQIDDVVRAAEAQTSISNERIHALTERLERSLDAAHGRLTEFEANVELELSAKLGEIERTLRAAEQTVERERT